LADTHENIPSNAFHREIDLLVYKDGGQSGLVDTFIICPSLIYGVGTGPVKKDSSQVPGVIKYSLEAKRAVTVGNGLNVWNNVHVEDLADFYLLLLEKAIAGEAKKVRFFFARGRYCKMFFSKFFIQMRGTILQRMGKTVSRKLRNKLESH
jgi:hypothetical protein